MLSSSVLNLHTEYSGIDFNKMHKNIKFYKFLNNDLTHYDFEYKVGLNIDTAQFNPKRECSGGGLYFCEESKCHFYFDQYGTKLALIEIPDDAKVYIEENKFKADKIFIKEIIDFDQINDNFWIDILSENCCALQYVKNQTEELCIRAVQQNGDALEYVKIQTNEICEMAVWENGHALEYVINQTDEICEMAVRQTGYALTYVINQTDKICILAVQQNGLALEYVINQTDEICILAVQQNGYALRFVKNQTDKICELAVQQYGNALFYVKKQTPLICELAVRQYGFAFENVEEEFLTKELYVFAVQQNGLALRCVTRRRLLYENKQLLESNLLDICKIAVQQNGLALQYVNKQFRTEEICNLAVEQNSLALQYVPK